MELIKLIHVSKINLFLDPETHNTAKAASATEGIGFYRWVVRSIRRAAGLPGEVPPVHEMSLEDKLQASVKQATTRRKQ